MNTSRDKVEFQIRRAEPGDYEAVRRVFTGPNAVRGTLQLPFPSGESWRKRFGCCFNPWHTPRP